MGFNPHTHEGCDTSPSIPSSYDGTVSIHTPTKGVTHTGFLYDNELCVSIHTPTKGVTQNLEDDKLFAYVSIHTPTKGVTLTSERDG